MLAVTDPRVHTVTVVCCTQLMKALDIETPIPTLDGFKRMGDIRVGDAVFDENGMLCQVVAKSEKKRGLPCYRIVFSDGSSIVCESEHPWPVLDFKRRAPERRIAKTDEILKEVKLHQNRNRYGVEVAAPLQLPEKSLPIDPYILGCWLGDGHSYSARVSLGAHDADHFKSEFAKRGFSLEEKLSSHSGTFEATLFFQGKTIFPILKKMGLLKNKAGGGKHIPKEYLRGSVNQRRDLLAGLLDTDGTATNGSVAITSKWRSLAEQIFDLCAGLGFKPRLKLTKVKYLGEVRIYWVVLITAYHEDSPFRLGRKTRGLFRKKTRKSETFQRRIVRVEKVPSRPVQCISVNSKSSLYLCGRSYIPTHNTELVNNIVGYHVDLDPAPIIVMQPTEKLARAWSQDRLDKMIRDTPVLADKFSVKKSRDASNTILHKEFAGGHITMVGANAPSDLAMRPVRIILCDEVDKYPASAGKEGDPIKLVSERSATFWNALKVHVCSPTIEGKSRIQSEYEQSDQRVFEVPCPHCNHFQEMKWAQVRWDEGMPETALYYCEACGEAWEEVDRLRSLQKGKWRATKPFTGHAGFKVSKLASPWEPLAKIAAKFLSSKKSPEKLKVFVNTQLAETWKERGEAPEWERLYERRESYAIGTVPKGVLFLTAGVDIQDNRIEAEVVGWGRDKQSWSVQTYVFEGSTASEKDAGVGGVWAQLDALLNETWENEEGSTFSIRVMAVDSGFRTQTVYNWCRRHPINRVIAVKGKESLQVLMNSGKTVDVKKGGQRISRGFKVFTVGVSIVKTELYGWLQLPAPLDGELYPPGYCHFPEYDDTYFKQLTAEHLITKISKGERHYIWEKIYERNEALDMRVYGRAAASYFGMDRFREKHWDQLESQITKKISNSPQNLSERPKLRRRPSTFL